MSCANMSFANMSFANLINADMIGAIISGYHVDNLYKHSTWWHYSDGRYYLALGCHNRLATDWTGDFWNNLNEFPNDGSEATRRRILAFNEMRNRMKIHVLENDNMTPQLQEFFDYEVENA
jgi:hypothetical protein